MLHTEKDITKTLERLRCLWVEHPYLRFGQLITMMLNIGPEMLEDGSFGKTVVQFDPYGQEDETLLNVLKTKLGKTIKPEK